MAQYQTTFANLDTFLKSLPVNTADTPYDIEITEITNSECIGNYRFTLQYYLQNNSTKYVILSFTDSQCTTVGAYACAGCNNVVGIRYTSNITSINSMALESWIKLKANLSELTALFSTLSSNTTSTPYTIEVINVVSDNLKSRTQNGTLGYIINNSSLYLDVFFSGNSSLKIYTNAFDSNRIISVNIPSNVTEIEEKAFLGVNLQSINVDSDNNYYFSDNGVLFERSRYDLICFPSGYPNDNYTIPNFTTAIKNYAFYGNQNLKAITISSSVTTISDYAFNKCNSLGTVTIPDSVTAIGQYAFAEIETLTSIIIGKSVNSIGNYAFSECPILEHVAFSYKFDNLHLYTLGTKIFTNSSVFYTMTVNMSDPATKEKFIAEYASTLGLANKTYTVTSQVSEVSFLSLNDALGYLSVNTTSTPHRIKVTELEASNLIGTSATAISGTLQYVLQQNSTKFVSLEVDSTCYSGNITSMSKSFKNCTNLVSFTGSFPNGVTNLSECFAGCTNLQRDQSAASGSAIQ